MDSLYWIDNIPKTSLNRTKRRWSRDAGTVSFYGENHWILNAYLVFFFHFFMMKCHHLINSEHGSRTNSRLENVRHYLSTLDRSPWFNSMHVHSPLENLSLHQSEWDTPQQNISPVINLNGGHPTICIPPFLPCTHNQCHRSHVFYIDLNGA